MGCVILWFLPNQIWWLIPFFLVLWPLGCGLKLESSPTSPKIIFFLFILIALIAAFSPTSAEVTILIVLNQYFLVAFPEEVFFRLAFYESFANRISSPKTLIFLNTLVFVFFHSPNREPLWLLVLSIPAIFLALAGLKLRNLWTLSLLHLALNLCDLWISGDFVRLIT